VTFEDITDLNQAILYKGTLFYADREDMKLEKNQVFIADILGLDIIDADSGVKYGTLADVITPGGREVYVIDDVRGGQFMIPCVPEFIIDVKDEGDGAGIFVRLIEGMRE
jgi:16S rRNA processing protein RimM